MMIDRTVSNWLFLCCFMVFSMVVIGGVTRLTESGLSIVDWRPVTGAIPPLSDSDWQDEFEKYKTSPQYNITNSNMDVEGFKKIYMWEYVHRLIGRTTGLVFLLPLIWFAAKRRVHGGNLLRLTGVFALGGLQGLVGWLMVKSGLKSSPHVSHYMLAFHLMLALVILAFLMCYAFRFRGIVCFNESICSRYRTHSLIAVLMVLFQCFMGALVAGLDAGHAFNTFPGYFGKPLPDEVFGAKHLMMNFLQSPVMVHFEHRTFAYFVAIMVISLSMRIMWDDALSGTIKGIATVMAVAVCMQTAIGGLTVLHGVPVALASMHQAMAVILFMLCFTTFLFFRRKAEMPEVHDYSEAKI